MSCSPNVISTDGLSSAYSDSATRAHPRPRHAPLITNPGGLVSDQGTEFVHRHHSQDDLFEPEQELDEAGDAISVLASELKEMRSRVWWRRPSALWFLCMKVLLSAASTSTSAPKVLVVTHLVCKTLRPEYTDQPRADHPTILFALGDEGSKLCNADLSVHATSTKLLLVMAIVRGVLGCLTTAYWGPRSDRKGRINTMRICVFNYVITDLTYLLVYSFLSDRKGAYWLLLITPFVEGLLGDLGTPTAIIHAYIADCTDSARRSRVFLIYQGMVYTGIAIGPALGSLLIRQSGDIRAAFYFALAGHLLFACMIWFIIPESLTQTQLLRAKATYNENMAQRRGWIGVFLAHLTSVLAPLKLFIPVTVTRNGDPLKRRKDWNLTLLAATHGLSNTSIGTFSFKFQYAALTFGWGAELLGYWNSVFGLTRAATLALVVPALISSLKGLSPPVRPSTPLAHKKPSTSLLDLNIARVSLFMEMASYVMMATARTGTMFMVYTIMGGLSAGYSPVIQSLALGVYTERGGEETGKLFGGLNVVHALGGSLLSPMLFGFTYSRTIMSFPQAMFLVGASVITLALLCTLFVRLPRGAADVFIVATEDGAVSDEERERLIPGDEE